MSSISVICPDCGKVFDSEALLRKHSSYHEDEPKECPECSKIFQNNIKLKDHIRRSHRGKVVCDLCPFEGSATNIKRHKESVHKDRKLTCEKCGKTLSRKDKLARHLESCSNKSVGKKICSFCPKTFKREDLLKKHMRVHVAKEKGEKEKESVNYDCPDCNKSYKHRQSLLTHKKNEHPVEQSNFVEGTIGFGLFEKKRSGKGREAQVEKNNL